MGTVNRRTFLGSLAGAGVSAAALSAASGPMPMGLNTYCLRAMRWDDAKLLDYTASLKLDAIFLQDSLDPKAMDPAHWKDVREKASQLGLHLETGGGGIFPKTADAFEPAVAGLRKNIERAAAMGSPIVRCVMAAERSALPPGPVEPHMETLIKVLRAVRSQVMDAGLKIAMETHKDLQAWEYKTVIESAGKEFVGTYLDTGNPVFVQEHPMTTLETLAPYALTLHLRDSVVYEHKRGVAVQWVPLGEGVVDFKAILARAKELCPNVHVYIKPITGRPPQVLPVYEREYWQAYPKARAAEFARFLTLAKDGHPYENHMVIEDLAGRPTPEYFAAAIQYQQREHMERSVEYGKKVLDLGVRWRG
jgi:sugar phosphate isomerase/epimerase